MYDGCDDEVCLSAGQDPHRPNLMSLSSYKALHFVLDSDDGIDHFADRCPQCSKSCDPALYLLVGLTLYPSQ